MNWSDEVIQRLSRSPLCGYAAGQPPATEPAALAALALVAHGLAEPAEQVGDWLAGTQADDGSVGVGRDAPTPRWTTSLAVLTWLALSNGDGAARKYRRRVARAVDWILALQGKVQACTPTMGHNTMLVAWPWAEGTHSWIEPTALHLLALKATGRGDHPRCREGVRMLIDRQLPDGGCNYGNTSVLGQTLRPHVQPSGLAMLALAGEADVGGRIERTLDYLRRTLSGRTTTNSLCWALMGLAAHGPTPAAAERWLELAHDRTLRRGGSPYQLALLALASLGNRSALVADPEGATIRNR